jgi:hypothetical protein
VGNGLTERSIFTAFTILYPVAALPAIPAWLGLKMASNWNKALPPHDPAAVRAEMSIWNRHAFLGLLTGLISVSFAWFAGILARFIMGLSS